MFKAKYKDKTICSFDIKNKYGLKDYKLEKQYREAGSNDDITCIDCGDPVILRSGEIRVPYFAHRARNYTCLENNRKSFESEEHKLGIQLLYNYFKINHNAENIEIDYKLDFGRRANLYIQSKERNFAVEYIVNPMSYAEWIKKDNDYNNNDVAVVWILSTEKFSVDADYDYDFLEMTVSDNNINQTIYSLNTNTLDITIAKYLEYVVEGDVFKRKFYKEMHSMNDLKFDYRRGFLDEFFINNYNQFKKEFNDTCQQEYERILQEEVKAEKQRLVEIERQKVLFLQEKAKRDEIAKKRATQREAQAIARNEKSLRNRRQCTEEKWGYCTECGKYTNEWWYFEPPNKCRCYCSQKRPE